MTSKLKNTVMKYKNIIYDDKIFFYPDIPSRKLNNAVKKYANINDETVLMLVDDTILGSAKAGLILTDRAIYIKDSNTDAFSCKISDIENITFKNYMLMQKLVINYTLDITFTQPKKKSLSSIADMLKEISGLKNEENTSWSNIGIGIGVGALFGGPIGAAIGAAIGASLENKNASKNDANDYLETDSENEILFVATLASLMAKMAKADGVITEDEADIVKNIFDELDFGEELRDIAISAFKYAKSDEHTIFEYAEQYSKLADDELKEFMYSTLWSISLADGKLVDEEKYILKKITKYFGMSNNKYDEYYSEYFSNSSNTKNNEMGLKECYTILNSTPQNTLKEIKIEYRKLVAEYHPDRIHSKGLPESFMKFANEQLQKINLAYEIIRENHI
jgi:DnaJ like chaperone protein